MHHIRTICSGLGVIFAAAAAAGCGSAGSYTPVGGQPPVIDGIRCDLGSLAYHVHSHLSLFVNGQQAVIPANIGIITGPGGRCVYGLHTHDTSGIIHVEAAQPANFTLGQFFDIWGKPLSTTNVAGNTGAETITVNGAPYTRDPRSIPLNARADIVINVGNPVVSPPPFDFSVIQG